MQHRCSDFCKLYWYVIVGFYLIQHIFGLFTKHTVNCFRRTKGLHQKQSTSNPAPCERSRCRKQKVTSISSLPKRAAFTVQFVARCSVWVCFDGVCSPGGNFLNWDHVSNCLNIPIWRKGLFYRQTIQATLEQSNGECRGDYLCKVENQHITLKTHLKIFSISVDIHSVLVSVHNIVVRCFFNSGDAHPSKSCHSPGSVRRYDNITDCVIHAMPHIPGTTL